LRDEGLVNTDLLCHSSSSPPPPNASNIGPLPGDEWGYTGIFDRENGCGARACVHTHACACACACACAAPAPLLTRPQQAPRFAHQRHAQSKQQNA
jgi:hypothetical protein